MVSGVNAFLSSEWSCAELRKVSPAQINIPATASEMNEYLFIDEPPLLGVKRWHDVSNRELFQCRLYTVRVSFLDLRKLLIHLGLCYLEAHTKPEIFTEVLSDEGEADRFLLQEMNGTAT